MTDSANVVLLTRKGAGEPPHEVPHIDVASRVLLLALLSELVAVRDSEPEPRRADRLRTITGTLCAIIERFEPPKGAA